MNFQGSVTIQAPRQAVWAFLTDPSEVSKCAPGLESMEVIEPGERFRVVASVGFGTVKVTFATDVTWLELQMPERAKMKAHGTAPGSAVDAMAEMNLADVSDGSTELSWEAEVLISGTIASLASRMMGSVAKKVTGAFFECVKGQIEG